MTTPPARPLRDFSQITPPDWRQQEFDNMEMTDILKKHLDTIEDKFGTLPQKFMETDARLHDIEQKMERGGGFSGGGLFGGAYSMGSQVAASEDFQILCQKAKNGVGGMRAGTTIETKAVITSATSAADGSAGDLLVPYRDSLVARLHRPLRVRDLLTVIQVSGNSVDVPIQTGYTNNAATVAEAATKPQSELQFDFVNLPIRTIAHWVLASTQILDDAPQLAGFIDSELRYGVDFIEDVQLLTGGGTGTDLNGIYTQATAFAAGTLVVPTPNKIDAIIAAILQVELTDADVTAIVMHPSDWTSILLAKDSGGYYLIGDPVKGGVVSSTGPSGPMIAGKPVVLTRAMTAGTFLVGDFLNSATLYDRWQTRVELSTEDSDNFRKNLCTIRAEKRIGLAVKRTTSFVKGSFSTAITDLTS
jgi:HK97 family phage major capsid protein